MDIVFINSENSKTSKSHVLVLKLTNKLVWRISKNVIASSNLSIYYTWKNINSSYNNNKFKIFASTWNDKLELPDGSHQVLKIILSIFKKHGEDIHKPPVEIYVNKIGNRITLEI